MKSKEKIRVTLIKKSNNSNNLLIRIFNLLEAPLFFNVEAEIFMELFFHDEELFCGVGGRKIQNFTNKDHPNVASLKGVV